MSTLKKVLVGLLIFVGLGVIAIVILAFSFVQGMKGDPKEEEKVRQQAEQYVREHFEAGTTSIYDVLYDNMGNFNFEYAAKVHHETYGTNFLVYLDEDTGEMADTFIEEKWRDDAEKAIQPYINEKLGESLTSKEMAPITNGDDWDEIQKQLKGKIELYVTFDEHAVSELHVDPNNLVSYNELNVFPDSIRLTIWRDKQDEDERIFNEIITTIQAEGIVQHGDFQVEYIQSGEQLAEGTWEKKF